MEKLIAKMRADWSVIAADRVASGEWTADDEKDIGQAVKAAVESKQPEVIGMWARWLADLSAWTCAYNLIVRSTEAGIRAKVAEEKAKQAAAGNAPKVTR